MDARVFGVSRRRLAAALVCRRLLRLGNSKLYTFPTSYWNVMTLGEPNALMYAIQKTLSLDSHSGFTITRHVHIHAPSVRRLVVSCHDRL